MSESEAIAIAEKFISSVNMRGYKAVFASARKLETQQNQWTVVFDLYTPNNCLFDTPMIIDVDEISGKAKLFSSL